MKSRIGLNTICLVMLACSAYSQMTKTIIVTNRESQSVTINPIDPARPATIPSELNTVKQQLPLGSFLLHNKTATPINAVVVQWVFKYQSGAVEQRKIQCDGYIIPPVHAIVRPNDFSLITPGACAKGELFSHFGTIAFGSPLTSRINSALLTTQADLEKVEITVDSIIFGDGGIWGPDTQKYYTKIWERHTASQSFVKECSEAAARGEDIRERAKRIHEEAVLKGDRASALRGHFAVLLAKSPDPAKTLAQLQSREALPEFHHLEEGKQ